ncbi:hypothetical protein DMN91_002422 [Ooceraea biroi]|uniref:AB hydrolase-1 domain-containing protein n=1 Tax=Ooceraea biroi TaxID=2015173 RepID=A0A3L8DV78_OOCBI|nr:hypothetical protein DMN91_002422 [Ooceraea biroi]
MASKVPPVETQKIKVADVHIYFARIGTGNHPVLFLPDALGGTRTFKSQIVNLDTERLTIVAWDPPGCGRSRPPDRTFPNNYFHRDAIWAHSFMKTLGYSKFSLVGYGDGGTTALLLAATYPEDILKMIVLGARSYIHPDEIERYKRINAARIKVFKKKLENAGSLSTQIPDLDYLGFIRAEWLDAMRRLYNQQNGNLCQEILPKIKCPTLILHASGDRFFVPDQPLRLKQNIVNSRLHIFEIDNCTLLSETMEYNKVISDFLLEE